MHDHILIKNARLHNLKNVTLSIPKNKLVVFTGISGSGKSSLAFDTLYKEGQRQFMESLGMVSYALSKPQVDGIEGLSPSISVDQHLTNHSPRSTVGTATDVFTYLRVLFARLGHRPCPACHADIPPSQDVNGAEGFGDEDETQDGSFGADESTSEETYPCPACGAPIPEIGMAHFSFNKPAGACPTCTGLGVMNQPDMTKLLDENLSIADGAVLGWDSFYTQYNTDTLLAAGQYYGFVFDPALPVKEYGAVRRDLLLYGVRSPQFKQHFPGTQPPTTVRQGHFEGIVTSLLRRYAEHASDPSYREKVEKLLLQQICPDCQGARLRPESRAVTVMGRTIVEVSHLPLTELAAWLAELPNLLSPAEWTIAEPILDDLEGRVRRLVDVGVGYLTLERSSPTVSAGEAQRLRLAALLGSGLTGVLYVLDEPTIGLHPRDTRRLIQVLYQLRDLGNTVLVIEHDLDMLRAADYVVDIGPGAGRNGGRVVVAGSPEEVAACRESVTGDYLSHRIVIPTPDRRALDGKALTIRGAREHNLKNITVRFPLGLLIAVTGVSGSGKSSLLFDILDRAARQRFYGASDPPGEHEAIEGWEHLDKIVTIDQTAIGRSPRSNAATYSDAFTPIREAFAATPEAQKRGLSARHFSFNVPGGRCERCEGAGVLMVSMHFLPDVQVRCPACHGRRFKREVLAVKYGDHGGGRDIAEVLDLTIEEALLLFAGVHAVAARLAVLVDVGLGYLKLGQPATTLSGGEAQRVKLAKELGRRAGGRTLYLLDEPTTGLHSADTARLLVVLQRLVGAASGEHSASGEYSASGEPSGGKERAGNTVIVIEHNLDVIKSADWVVDLGPEGGAAGGWLLAEGTPEQVAQVASSSTGKFLREMEGLG